jgi:hypothetical protein
MDPMIRRQRQAMFAVAAIAVFALPAYLILGLLTIPIGIGILMLTSSTPWILTLYPFLFAGHGHWKAPVYYLDLWISLPLTIVQWTLIAWLAGRVSRDCAPRQMWLRIFLLLLGFGLAAGLISWAAGVQLMWASAHT